MKDMKRLPRVHVRTAVPIMLAWVACGVLVIGGCAHSTAIKGPGKDPELQARLDELSKAYETMNLNSVMSFYSPEMYSLSFDLPYMFDTGAGAHKTSLKDYLENIQDVRLRMGDDTQVWRDKDRAWTLRSFTLSGKTKTGEPVSFTGQHSAIWEKKGNQWLITYEHFWGQPSGSLVAAKPTTVPPPPYVPPKETPAPEPTPPPPPPETGLTTDSLHDIFFDYDKWDIRPDQRDTLAADADLLKKYPTAEVLIEGHCDERGTVPYNVRLGERRAKAVQHELIAMGIAASRIQVKSVGKSEPFVPGHDESAWHLNRRAHFVVIKQ